jgi:hypothetical protein
VGVAGAIVASSPRNILLCGADPPCAKKRFIEGKPSNTECKISEPVPLSVAPKAVVHYYIMPSSRWATPEYRNGGYIEARQTEATSWWKEKYCIDVEFREFVIPLRYTTPVPDQDGRIVNLPLKHYIDINANKMQNEWMARTGKVSFDWPLAICKRSIDEPSRDEMDRFKKFVAGGLNDAVNAFNRENAGNSSAQVRLLVIYCDVYAGDGVEGKGQVGWGSMTSANFPQIGIWLGDRNTTHILTHELVHAFGKKAPNEEGGSTSWYHTSCANSMQSAFRADACKLGHWNDEMLLHWETYKEIIENGFKWLFENNCKE